MIKRTATALWNGTGKSGTGILNSESKALDKAFYTWSSRFENAKGTNPEELLAAAHAGCFSMKLSFLLEKAGFQTEMIETTAEVAIEKEVITESHLSVKAKIPNISNEQFYEISNQAKLNCPISKALRISVTLERVLLGDEVTFDH